MEGRKYGFGSNALASRPVSPMSPGGNAPAFAVTSVARPCGTRAAGAPGVVVRITGRMVVIWVNS